MAAPAILPAAQLRGAWDDLRAGVSRWRDRLLAAPTFHAWAARAPLFRLVARREARAMFDLCAGFVYSQILFTVVRLDVLEHLRDGPLPTDTLLGRLPLPADGARTLIEGAIALKLLERRSRNRLGLGARGAVLIANEGLREMILHHELLYADLAEPVGLLRGTPAETRLSAYWAYARTARPAALDETAVDRYSRLMAVSQDMVSQAVIGAYDFRRHRRLLDVGGGEGRFVANVLRAAPRLEANVFDLPAVAARATQRLEEAGFGARAAGIGGSFLEAVPALGADVLTLVRVLHDHDDEPVRCLLRKVRAVLTSGGTLVVAEPMIEHTGGDVVSAAYFGMYLTAMRSGRPRSTREIRQLLADAGFERVEVRVAPGPLPLCLAVARVN